MSRPSSLLRSARRASFAADKVLAVQSSASDQRPMARYEGKPVLYAKEQLGIEVWDRIGEVLESIHVAPYRTLVKSGHKVGKSCACGILINYWFDVYDPGVVITTGASWDAMSDTVWSEVRMQRTRAGRPDLFIGPAAPEMRTGPDHWAKLFSVNKGESFQGKHRGRMMFLFDEAVGVERAMFTIAQTMFKPEPEFAWVCFYNPTDVSSPVYAEENTMLANHPKWKVFSLSSLDHPNVVAQIKSRREGRGELASPQLPMPNAVSISQIDIWVRDWCLPIDERSRLATDFRWTFADGSASWWRPQMDWEARCTGNWPTQATSSVWSDHLFTVMAQACGAAPIYELPQIGCDVARQGDDKTAVHERWGSLSLAHGSRQGLRTTETTGWLREVADELARMVTHMRKEERNHRPSVTGREIPIKVDDDGVGGGVVDQLFEAGYNVTPVRAGTIAGDPSRYPNKRSELWFNTARRALESGIAFSSIGSDGIARCRLDNETVQRIKLQAVAPTWKMDSVGRRVVEAKADTKKRLGRSPDDMDAMNLAYYEFGFEAPQALDLPLYDKSRTSPTSDAYRESGQAAAREGRGRRLFGR